MCGESMTRTVRSLFAAHLHQGGYLRVAQEVAYRLSEIHERESKKTCNNENTSSSSSSSNVNVNYSGDSNVNNTNNDDRDNTDDVINEYDLLTSLRPPDFLILAWEHAMKLRVTARTLFQTIQSTQSVNDNEINNESKNEKNMNDVNKIKEIFTIKDINEILYNRILFLFEIESNSANHLLEYMGDSDALFARLYNGGNKEKDINSSSNNTISHPIKSDNDNGSDNNNNINNNNNNNNNSFHLNNSFTDFEIIMNTNLSFVTDPRVSIPHIRTFLDSAQGKRVGNREEKGVKKGKEMK